MYHKLCQKLEELKVRAFNQNYDHYDVVRDVNDASCDEEIQVEFVYDLLENSPEVGSTAEGQMRNAMLRLESSLDDSHYTEDQKEEILEALQTLEAIIK